MLKEETDIRQLPRLENSFLLTMIRGAIGKEYVVKHYGSNLVISRFPRMEHIIASPAQRTQRNLFKEAVAYAKKVLADPVQKAALEKKIRRKTGLFNEAIKEYMLKEKKEKVKAVLQTERLLRQAFSEKSKPEKFSENRFMADRKEMPASVWKQFCLSESSPADQILLLADPPGN